MIKAIIDLLAMDDFYGVSETVDFAKGSHKRPSNWRAVKELIKRHMKRNK